MSRIRNILIAAVVAASLVAAPSAFAFGQLKIAKGTSTGGTGDPSPPADTTQASVVGIIHYMILMAGL